MTGRQVNHVSIKVQIHEAGCNQEDLEVILHDVMLQYILQVHAWKLNKKLFPLTSPCSQRTNINNASLTNGKIMLNLELIKASKGSIEYIIIHELCHLVHHNHTKAFYELQEKLMPDWKKWKERLEYCLA